MEVHRGDIVLVDLNPTAGSEQNGTRPAVVVQNDVGNQFAPTTSIAPMTTRYDPSNIRPYEAFIPEATTASNRDAVALLNQIRTVSVAERVLRNFGSVNPEVMADIEDAIRVSLDL